jgi:hypothetical protein
MKKSCFAAILLFASLAVAQNTILERLQVDATDAPRNILHATVTVPVTSADVTLVTPSGFRETTVQPGPFKISPACISGRAARSWNGSATW